MKSVVKLGLIGCGAVGKKRAIQLAGGHLVGMCDLEESNYSEVAFNRAKLGHPRVLYTSNYMDIINDHRIDAVIVSTPHSTLTEITRAAMTAGKHVLVEKPVSGSPEEIRKLFNDKPVGTVVQVGFNHRFHPAVDKAKKLVDSGIIGEVMHIRARYGHGGRLGYESEWRGDPSVAAGGELLEQGVHVIDLAAWFLNDANFTSIDGFATTSFWKQELDDNAFMTLRDDAGHTVFAHVSCTEWKNKFSFEVFGRKGKVEVEGLGSSYGVERCHLYVRPDEFGYPETTIFEYPGDDRSWEREHLAFYEAINSGIHAIPDLTSALKAVSVVDVIYKKGKRIEHRDDK